jgi:hypothetical protein
VPQPDDQAAFIRAFAATTVVQETLRRRSKSQKISGRVPTSIAAIERRWFAGKHTVHKAQKKAALLLPQLDRIGAADTDLALAGTAAMFELAAQGTGMVQIEASSQAPGYVEMRLAIASRRRGRPSKQAAAAVAASSPGGRSAPGADSESGWALIPEDHSVFSIGVRRHLRENGWTCPPWDDTGHGTCTKEWRNLVDNKRIQLAKRPKGTPVTKTLRSDTIAKWDARAQKPGYTVALCKAVVDFRDARQPDDTADDAAVSAGGEMQRLYYVDSTVATACRQFAEQQARARSPSVDPVPYLSVTTEHPQAQACNADQQPAGSEVDLTCSGDLLPVGVETAAAEEEKVPWTTQEEAWVSGSPWSDTDYMHLMINSTSSSGGSSTESGGSNAGGSSTGGSNSPWSDADVDVESFPMPDLWDDDGGGAGNFVDGAAAAAVSAAAASGSGDKLWDDWGDGGGGQDSAAGSSSISGASSESSFGSASAAAATFQPKRSLSPGGGRDHDDGAAGAAAAAAAAAARGVPPAKIQRTLAAASASASAAAATKRRGASKTSAAACLSAGAVALAFILLVSAGQFSTNQQTSMDPHARIEPETERWQCVPEPSSVLPHWTDSDLCRSDPTARFPCTLESRQSEEASCAARHGVLIGRICRCDGCFTGGECMAWENKGDEQELCSNDAEEIAVGAIAASDSGGAGSQNKTTCQCSGSGNAIACSNGEARHCGAGKECTARVWSRFDYGDWSAACKDAPLVPRPQWRQQLRGAAYAHRGSPAIMWLAGNSTLYLYLFASGD